VAEGLLNKKLEHIPIWAYIESMARAATTSDAFNAVAEPRRRDILNYLAMQERSVTDALQDECYGDPAVARMDEHVRAVVETPASANQGTGRDQQCTGTIVLWNFK